MFGLAELGLFTYLCTPVTKLILDTDFLHV